MDVVGQSWAADSFPTGSQVTPDVFSSRGDRALSLVWGSIEVSLLKLFPTLQDKHLTSSRTLETTDKYADLGYFNIQEFVN